MEIGYLEGNEKRKLSKPLNLSLEKGKVTCLVGPNGAGKSTLLRTISKMQHALNGKVFIHDKVLSSYSNKELSKILGTVLTEHFDGGFLTVRELLEMGRIPHTAWWGTLTDKDKTKVEEVADLVGVSNLLDRYLHELSDGQMQKALIGRVLSQDSELILLDEPTSHLDIPNKIELYKLLNKIARTKNKCILLTTHDLELALQTADQIWLFDKDQIISGTPEELVLGGDFSRAFSSEDLFDIETGKFLVNQKKKIPIKVQGDAVARFWLLNALHRLEINLPKEVNFEIFIERSNHKTKFELFIDNQLVLRDSLNVLLHYLMKYSS
ncbi:ABC transporter ATP-binding protein [Sediminitomix flava]|uniref:ABC transporter ATP-binding protein n=1 Tax=Sediminitomix flava TaxID=379075 RepID=UPI00130488AF|nr:ABC transporter ATP-binding protein [Sediminitomix flava]